MWLTYPACCCSQSASLAWGMEFFLLQVYKSGGCLSGQFIVWLLYTQCQDRSKCLVVRSHNDMHKHWRHLSFVWGVLSDTAPVLIWVFNTAGQSVFGNSSEKYVQGSSSTLRFPDINNECVFCNKLIRVPFWSVMSSNRQQTQTRCKMCQ